MVISNELICIAPTGDWCGEGVIWHPEEKAVFWVDNRRNLVHRFLVEDQSTRTWLFDETVAALALTVDPGVLCVVLGSRLILWSPATDERLPFGGSLEGWPQVRLNEAGVDPRGFLWLGSMGNNLYPDGTRREVPKSDGSLFQLDREGALSRKVGGIGVANTIAWSPDRENFYSADSLENEVRVYQYDLEKGGIHSPRPFFKGFPRGLPDGSAIDSEGSLWNCRYGGGCIVRVSDRGEIQAIVESPALNVTSCAFGGAGLDTLYVTSAISDASPRSRFDGGLFAVRPGVCGYADNARRMRL